MENTTPNPYLTIEEAAKFAGLQPSTIRLAIRTGDLEVEKIGRRTYIRSRELKNFLGELVIG